MTAYPTQFPQAPLGDNPDKVLTLCAEARRVMETAEYVLTGIADAAGLAGADIDVDLIGDYFTDMLGDTFGAAEADARSKQQERQWAEDDRILRGRA